MQPNPRFIMIGGFLGAGKTTAIARLALHFQKQKQRVIVVTNDQATDLVDTNLLRSQGFEVGEVAGSCFCCNFNELTNTIEKLAAHERPDIILAEPVGSCTDLVATVIRPLQQIYAQPFDIAPYGVIVKPSHGAKILNHLAQGGFSPQAEYIFRKQIEEADFVLINRIDELPPAEIASLANLLAEQFPGRPIVKLSAKTGQGFDQFLAALDQPGPSGQRTMDVDYDEYAIGEAELGWLNSQLDLTSPSPFLLDSFLLAVLQHVRRELAQLPAETAHLKAIGMCDDKYAVANLISSDSEPIVSLPSAHLTHHASIVINARVAIDPDSLATLVRHAVAIESSKIGASATINTMQSFRPGRPVPTHRILVT